MVLAYKEGEKIGTAIPYDIKESKDKQVKLVLKPGKYNVILTNEKGKALRLKYKAK